jgi:putative RNA 2'-phosphotransferase
MSRQPRQRAEALAHRLRYILGKSPDEFGLVLDPDGWVATKSLLQAMSEETGWKGVHASQIIDLSWQLDPCPLEIEEKRVRLLPGGSGDLAPPVRENLPPPALLYYGCRRRPYAVYRTEGIAFPSSTEIVLARSREMALRIAKRRDPHPILVEIQTRIALSHASRFQSYGNHLFVVDFLPSEALFGPPPKEEIEVRPKKKPAPRGEGTHPSAPHPDSFHPGAWNPAEDRLLARDPEEAKKRLKRERDRKRIDWKDASRGERRKGRRDSEP